MIGGNYRRLKRFEDAISDFERGRQYEEDGRFEVNSSYNLINEIVLPIEEGMKTAADQRGKLQAAAAVLEQQVRGGRRRDRWAWADLGECLLLLGDLERARSAYDEFISLGDTDSIKSARAVLQRLCAVLVESDGEAAVNVDSGLQQLERATRG